METPVTVIGSYVRCSVLFGIGCPVSLQWVILLENPEVKLNLNLF